MARLAIDLTGRGGLAPAFQGDLNDAAAPNLRYMGADTQVADGIYDPLRVLGFMAPANNTFADLTGTITEPFVSRVYDSISDRVFLAQSGTLISQVDGLNGTAITDWQTVSSSTVQDLEMYEVNAEPAVLYSYYRESSTTSASLRLGFKSVNDSKGAFTLAARVFESGVSTASETIASGANQKLAQKFSTSDTSLMDSTTVSGFRMRLRDFYNGAVAQTWTLQAGIQTDSAGSPSGTYVASGSLTMDPNDLPPLYGYVYFTFASPIVLSPWTTYHLVLEPTVWADISGSDGVLWLRSDGAGGLYPSGQAQQYNGSAWSNADASTDEAFDFALIINEGALTTQPGLTGINELNLPGLTKSFLQKADNGFLYFFTGNYVHKFDGGFTGGNVGTFTPSVLAFPTYLQCVDAVDTNSVLYIAIQSTGIGTAPDYRTFNADTMGVYSWDRISTATSTKNFTPIYGAREIRRIFVNGEGELRVITIGEDGFTELRGVVNGKLQVIRKMGKFAYPPRRDSLDVMNNLATWLGADGNIYALGKLPGASTENLYKVGTILGEVSGTLSSGIFLAGNEGSSDTSQGVFLSWADSGKTLTKWYPHGVGTINSVAQLPNTGNVYTRSEQLPYLSNVSNLMITCAPRGIAADTTTVATLKFYKNMEATPFMTKTVRRKNLVKGYLSYAINKQYVNSFQIEIEWASQTMGSNDFLPAFAVLDYTATKTVPSTD